MVRKTPPSFTVASGVPPLASGFVRIGMWINAGLFQERGDGLLLFFSSGILGSRAYAVASKNQWHRLRRLMLALILVGPLAVYLPLGLAVSVGLDLRIAFAIAAFAISSGFLLLFVFLRGVRRRLPSVEATLTWEAVRMSRRGLLTSLDWLAVSSVVLGSLALAVSVVLIEFGRTHIALGIGGSSAALLSVALFVLSRRKPLPQPGASAT